ncbi:MAG: site-specific integrase [Desulfobacterales bacterium]|jgi:site-specific recombinase XerD
MKKRYRSKWNGRTNYNNNQYIMKECISLPHPIEPKDIKQILNKIRGKPRDRAMILILLRTGMRICELLSTKIQDINLRERKILIFESAKNRIGRVAYLSEDARIALGKWIKIRNQKTDYLFYGHRGRPLSYEAARSVFKKYSEKAGLSQKGYTLHCLRHTFASELLSAGMPIESLQYLMGHSSIVVTRRYARLSNIALENDYFSAMQKIERGETDGLDGNDYEI